MKHLKSIYSILEKQLKLYPDFEKTLPDNPKEVANKYLKDRDINSHIDKSKSDIDSWDEGQALINDEEKQKSIMRGLSGEDMFDERLMGIIEYEFDRFEDIIKKFIVNYYDDIEIDNYEENVNDFDSLREYLEEIEKEIEDIIHELGEHFVEKGYGDEIFNMEYLEKVDLE